jgi:hypothetical protein
MKKGPHEGPFFIFSIDLRENGMVYPLAKGSSPISGEAGMAWLRV